MIFLPLCAKIPLFSLPIRLFSPPLHRPQLTRKGLLWHLLIKDVHGRYLLCSNLASLLLLRRCDVGWAPVYVYPYLHIAFLNMQWFNVMHRVAVVSYPQE